MRYVIGTVKGKRSKKVATLHTFDSLTDACVKFDDIVKANESKDTRGITFILADTTRQTLVKARQF